MKKIKIEASCANCWCCSDTKGDDSGRVCSEGGVFDKINIAENDVCMYWKPYAHDMLRLIEAIWRNEEEK